MIEPPWLTIANDEVGIKEIPGPGDHPRIVEYHQSTQLRAQDDEVPWCSAFVNWCITQSGYTGTNLASARSWLAWGVGLGTPAHGCIVVLWRERPDSWKGHVGFLVGASEDSVYLLGGNQSNSVSLAEYPMERVLGYRWLRK